MILTTAHLKANLVFDDITFDRKKSLNLRYIIVNPTRAQTLDTKRPGKSEYTDLNDTDDYAALHLELRRLNSGNRKAQDVIELVVSMVVFSRDSDVEVLHSRPDERKAKVQLSL